MNQKIFKIELLTDKKLNRTICEEYWEITDNLQYKYKVKELSDKHDIYPNGISRLVQTNSNLSIYCKNCCNMVGQYNKRSDFELSAYQVTNDILCEDCYLDKEKLIAAAITQRKLNDMEMAAKTGKYKELNQFELKTLIEITESRTKKEVVKKVFKGADLSGNYAQNIWKKINLLDDMNLIWVEREVGGSRIINYHVNGKLRQMLRNEYPDLFMPIKEDEAHRFKKFQFIMNENFSKKSRQPDYSGFFKVKEEVILKPNEEYQYGGWKNDDGTLFIKIEPVDLIDSGKFNLDDLTDPFLRE